MQHLLLDHGQSSFIFGPSGTSGVFLDAFGQFYFGVLDNTLIEAFIYNAL